MVQTVDSPRAHMSPLRFLGVVLVVLGVLTGATMAGVFTYGRDSVWESLFGPPDLGPYDFDTPTRTGKVNDALACPESAEPCATAAVDHLTPLFAVDAQTLFAEARRRIGEMPGAAFAVDDADRLSLRAVVRTPFWRFPDTLSLRVREEGPGASAIWVYSRSQIGHADLGTNDRRVRSLLRKLRRALPLVEQQG